MAESDAPSQPAPAPDSWRGTQEEWEQACEAVRKEWPAAPVPDALRELADAMIRKAKVLEGRTFMDDPSVSASELLRKGAAALTPSAPTGEPSGDERVRFIRGHLFTIRALSNGHRGIIAAVNSLARRLGVEPPATPISEVLMGEPSDAAGRSQND